MYVPPVSEEAAVLAAAERRAKALVDHDGDALRELLHPWFRWTTFSGEVMDRDSYIASNTGPGVLHWREQRLESPEVAVVGETAMLTGTVVDEVQRGDTIELFRLRLTQVWVRSADGVWLCLGGHAGPRLS